MKEEGSKLGKRREGNQLETGKLSGVQREAKRTEPKGTPYSERKGEERRD